MLGKESLGVSDQRSHNQVFRGAVSVDGEEDHKIHCIKDGEVAAAARRLIKSKNKSLHEPHDIDSIDPFADLDMKKMKTKLKLLNVS